MITDADRLVSFLAGRGRQTAAEWNTLEQRQVAAPACGGQGPAVYRGLVVQSVRGHQVIV